MHVSCAHGALWYCFLTSLCTVLWILLFSLSNMSSIIVMVPKCLPDVLEMPQMVRSVDVPGFI